MSELTWEFDNIDTTWDAISEVRDEWGDPCSWVICVCDDGSFAVDESSAELTNSKQTFDTLARAKDWCQRAEWRLLLEAQCKASQPDEPESVA